MKPATPRSEHRISGRIISCAWLLLFAAALPARAQAAAATPPAPATVSGSALIALADSLWARASETGAVPDNLPLILPDASQIEVSAALAFNLFLATINLWQTDGSFPASVLLPSTPPAPPQLDPRDILPRPSDPSRLPTRQLAAASLIAQCPAIAQWAFRVGGLPTAVWIDGERYSAGEFLVAMAQFIQQASRRSAFPASLLIPRCVAPRSWPSAGPAASAQAAPPASLPVLVTPQPPGEAAPPAQPRFSLLPHTGTKVSGFVDLVGEYSGPPPKFVAFLIDGKDRYLTNSQPYSYRWRLEGVAPGEHRVTARAFGQPDEVLAEASIVLLVVPASKADRARAENEF